MQHRSQYVPRQQNVSTGINTIYAWGDNLYGQIGNGTNGNYSNVPISTDMSGILANKLITQVSACDFFSLALDSEGKVYSWGYNANGQLGNNTLIDALTPSQVYTGGVLSGIRIVRISAGNGSQSLALGSNGKVYSWGINIVGQLGNNTNISQSNIPVEVYTGGILTGKRIVEIAAGGRFSLALDSEGKVYSWGINTNGSLGNNTNIVKSNVPVAVYTGGVLSGKKIVQVSANGPAAVLDSTGHVYTWGDNFRGQLGIGSNIPFSNVPVAVYTGGVLAGKKIKHTAVGLEFMIVADESGKVYTWGTNLFGQLGNNTLINSNIPVAVVTNGVLAGKNIIGVAAGDSTSLALDSMGKVYSWGNNGSGQLGNGTNISFTTVPVSVYTAGNLSGKTVIQISMISKTALVLAR